VAPYNGIKNRADIARTVELEELLKRTGCDRYRFDKNKWHTPQGAISIKGDKFSNWNGGFGGGGAISLIMHLTGYDFKSSVDWIFRHFYLSDISINGNRNLTFNKRNHHHVKGKCKTLRLPPRDDGKLFQISCFTGNVWQYLHQALIQTLTGYHISSTRASKYFVPLIRMIPANVRLIRCVNFTRW
jgi:hypothetical protein